MSGARGYIVGALIALAMVACGKRGGLEEATIARRTARGASAVLQNTASLGLPLDPIETKVWGEINGDADTTFQQRVVGLLQATLSPGEIGTVSSRSGLPTGVRFWGAIELQGGSALTSNMAATSINVGSSQLRIVVWDSLTGTTDFNGNRVPEYPIYFSRALSGTVTGNTAELRFQDAYGEIRLQGTFDTNFFQGQVSYQNTRSFATSSAARSDTLGNFVVRTCGFFRCK